MVQGLPLSIKASSPYCSVSARSNVRPASSCARKLATGIACVCATVFSPCRSSVLHEWMALEAYEAVQAAKIDGEGQTFAWKH